MTLINGDAHIYNFMFSKDIHSAPIIIDFQFAEPGLGCLDLAHLTRKIPPQMLTYEFCHNIVHVYYQSLLKFGIKNYTFSECLMTIKVYICNGLKSYMAKYNT
ncbi:hypothetical protein C823_001271 [Eubacterium plexicaudatum ASF492]|nr:hypothetical protein C823_001271 [Eubacterium plexicaudatum ASF492]